jgi:integrase/recombinase XerD
MYALAAPESPVTGLTVILPQQVTSDDHLVHLFLGKFRSVNTRNAYEGDVRLFRALVDKPLRTVTLDDIQAFAESLSHWAPATVSRRLSAIKSLWGRGMLLGYFQFNVAEPIELPEIKDRTIERVMSESDVHALLRAAWRVRDQALLRLIYGAGLRVSEACALRWRDLTSRGEAGQINVMGKGAKTRAILLPAALYTRVYTLRGNAGDDDPVFLSRTGRPLLRGQVHTIIKSVANRARLKPNISPHFLRHSHCSHALDRGAPVHVIRETLGHASLVTTTRYSHMKPGDGSALYLADA